MPVDIDSIGLMRSSSTYSVVQTATAVPGVPSFPAERMLLLCDNASVHKADEFKKLMEKHGIILIFLPPNMTQ